MKSQIIQGRLGQNCSVFVRAKKPGAPKKTLNSGFQTKLNT